MSDKTMRQELADGDIESSESCVRMLNTTVWNYLHNVGLACTKNFDEYFRRPIADAATLFAFGPDFHTLVMDLTEKQLSDKVNTVEDYISCLAQMQDGEFDPED